MYVGTWFSEYEILETVGQSLSLKLYCATESSFLFCFEYMLPMDCVDTLASDSENLIIVVQYTESPLYTS